MAVWAARRFWTSSTVEACDGGFTIRLDARPVKTPAKRPLVVPRAELAHAIAAEWDAQTQIIDPGTMPLTRASNSALDKVAPQREGVLDEISGFGGTDLLCYRAEGPKALVDRQAQGWDPLLDWAAKELGAPLTVTAGVIPVRQPPDSLARLREHLAAQSHFHLTALHDLVAISGSLILGLAVASRRLDADEAFALSRIDEAWQAEQWGDDEEAAETTALRLEAFRAAERFLGLCG